MPSAVTPEDFMSLNIVGRQDSWNVLGDLPLEFRMHLRRLVDRVIPLAAVNHHVPMLVVRSAMRENSSYGVAVALAIYRERLRSNIDLLPCDWRLRELVGVRLDAYPVLTGHGITFHYLASDGSILRACHIGIDGYHQCY